MSGIDLETMAFTEPSIVLEEQIRFMTQLIGELNADMAPVPVTKLPAGTPDAMLRLKNALNELKAARTTIPAKTDQASVDLVRKYYSRIVAIAHGR